jgi:hypothetical protein
MDIMEAFRDSGLPVGHLEAFKAGAALYEDKLAIAIENLKTIAEGRAEFPDDLAQYALEEIQDD